MGKILTVKQFYKSKKWKIKRRTILRRDYYKCQHCKSADATTVHHIIPLRIANGLALIDCNLISLCSRCHERMHDRNNDQLSDIGKEWVLIRYNDIVSYMRKIGREKDTPALKEVLK